MWTLELEKMWRERLRAIEEGKAFSSFIEKLVDNEIREALGLAMDEIDRLREEISINETNRYCGGVND